MAFQELTVDADWPATPSYTAAADTAVTVANPNQRESASMTWVITEDDTVPTLGENLGVPLGPGERESMKLASGERLWLAAPSAGAVSYPATLVTGPA